MDVVERYLKTVASALPEEQRADIIRELSEDIHSEIEDKQNELGRSLADAEQQALLKKRGNPLLLAARYRQDQRALVIGRQLIGPVLFPFYVKVLTFNLGLTSFVIGVIFLALELSGNSVAFHDIVSTCLLQLFIQLAAVTLIFALIEKHLAKHLDSWDPGATASGPRFGLDFGKTSGPSAGSSPRISRFESVSIIIACTVALVWITGVQSYPFLILGPAATFLKLTDVWYQMFFPIVLLTVLEIVRATINLVRPDWVRFRAIYGALLHIGGLLVVFYLLRAGSWVAASGSVATHAADYAKAVQVVNQSIYYALLLAAVLSLVQLAIRVTKLFRRPTLSQTSAWRWVL